MRITQSKIVVTGVFFVLIILSGYWLSAAKNLPTVIRTLHLVLTFLTALSTAAAFYLLLRRE